MPKGKQAPATFPRWARWTLSMGVLAVSAVLIVGLLPRGGISTDLSQIGQGHRVAVLTHETASPVSMALMDLVNRFRAESEVDIEFLVAHLGSPDGDRFARLHNTWEPGLLIFFTPEGEPYAMLRQPQTKRAIQEAAEATTPMRDAPHGAGQPHH